MKLLIPPFQDYKVEHVDEAIKLYRDYIDEETPLEIDLIYFSKMPLDEELFILKFLLYGFSDNKPHVISVLDNITKEEARDSWVKFYR